MPERPILIDEIQALIDRSIRSDDDDQCFIAAILISLAEAWQNDDLETLATLVVERYAPIPCIERLANEARAASERN